MKTTRTLLAFLALGPLALANEWAADKLEYAPKPGTTLSKHISVESEMELDQMTMELDGNDVGDMAGQVEVAMKTAMKLSVTDHYESVAGGRPTKLKRTFDEVTSTTHQSINEPTQGNKENDMPLESELEGVTVAFVWDSADESYDVAFEGEEGDEALLEGLTEDIDFRGLLPQSEVSENDSWKVPADAIKALLAPGGELKLRPSGDASSDPMSSSGMDLFSQNDMVGALEGDFDATYAGTREEDGARVAVIKLTIEARTAQDMSSKLDAMKEQMKQNLPPGLEVDVSTMDIEYELEAEGELLWDLETDLVSGLTLSGEMKLLMDMSMDLKMGGEGEKSMDISQTYVGTQTFTLTTGE